MKLIEQRSLKLQARKWESGFHWGWRSHKSCFPEILHSSHGNAFQEGKVKVLIKQDLKDMKKSLK